MFSFLIKCLQQFGLRGLIVYLKVKLNLTKAITIPGLKHPLTMRPNRIDKITFREIFIRQEYDISLPPDFKPSVIIDAGANIGFTSLFFTNRFPEARIFSIEPDGGNFSILSRNTQAYSNITPLKNALWHTNETINIVDKGYGERGFMVEKGESGNLLDGVSLRFLMEKYKFNHIDLLKIDIEGSEKEVFSSDYETWLPVTKCLVIELHDRMKRGCSKAVFEAISKYNFSVSTRGENFIFTNDRFL